MKKYIINDDLYSFCSYKLWYARMLAKFFYKLMEERNRVYKKRLPHVATVLL